MFSTPRCHLLNDNSTFLITIAAASNAPWKMIVGWSSTLFFLGSIPTIYSLLVAYMAIGHIIEIKHYTNFQNELLKTYKLYWTFVVFVLLIIMCVHVHRRTGHNAHVRSQDNSQKSILTCYPVGSCNWTQVVRPLVKHLLSDWHTGNNIQFRILWQGYLDTCPFICFKSTVPFQMVSLNLWHNYEKSGLRI